MISILKKLLAICRHLVMLALNQIPYQVIQDLIQIRLKNPIHL